MVCHHVDLFHCGVLYQHLVEYNKPIIKSKHRRMQPGFIGLGVIVEAGSRAMNDGLLQMDQNLSEKYLGRE